MKQIFTVLSLTGIILLSGCASNGSRVPVDNAWSDVASTQSQHRVQPGETIYTIAWRYGLEYHQLAAWNHLQKPYYLQIGQTLRLAPPESSNVSPDAVAAAPSFAPVSSSAINVALPTSDNKVVSSNASKATRTQSVSSDNEPSNIEAIQSKAPAAKSIDISSVAANGKNWPWPVKGRVINTFGSNASKGIDIAVPAGTPVKAVQGGTVVYAGSNLRGYGQLLIVKQKENVMAAYAHNSRLLVKEGSTVKTGQTIAMSGDTEAPQAMLHFEVRLDGKPVDPLPYLRKA